MTTTHTTSIVRAKLPELQFQLDRLSKRAVKLGLAPIELRILSEYTEKIRLGGKEDTPVLMAAIEITYELVKLAGWQFVAAFDHTPAGNIIRKAPGFRQELPSSFQTTPQACTHCNVNRNRTNTFLVLQEATGQFKQVGRSCLKDFTGHVSPESLAAWAAAFFDSVASAEDPSDESFGGSRGVCTTSITEVLVWVLRSVKAYGFRSSKCEHGSTISNVSGLMFNAHKIWKEQRSELEFKYPTPEILEEAAAILAWAEALPEEGLNDYLWNLRVALLNGYLMPKTLGVICSVTVALENDKARQARRAQYAAEAQKRAEERAHSQYRGKINERIEFTATIVFTKYLESDFGGKFLVVLQDDAGNSLKSFYSGKDERLYAVGGPYLFKGTVDRHSEYKGVKETMLKRLSLEKELPPPPSTQAELEFAEVV